MVWRASDELDRARRARLRAAVVWGLLALLVATALGLQYRSRASAQVALTEPIRVGRLVARLPAGWLCELNGSRGPQVTAIEPSAGGISLPRRVLHIELLPQEGYATAADFLEAHYKLHLPEARPISVAGQRGAMAPLQAGDNSLLAATALLGDGLAVLVTLSRFGDHDPRDVLLLQQVAHSVELAPEQAPP